MATLEKIRKNGVLLAIVIGGALLAFILGDMIKSGKSLLGTNKMHVAVVNGKSIDINNYQNKISETEEYVKIIRNTNNLDEQTTQQIRSSVWDMAIRDKVLEATYDQLGLKISKEELEDMVIGNNINPMISQTFVNPQTGVFDKNIVINLLKNLDKDQKVKNLWLYMESYIKAESIYKKYTDLATKGLYVNKLEVLDNNQDRKHLVDIDLLAKTINDISDDQIKYTDEDLQKYYDAHKHLFVNNQQTRDISYITFDVIPTKADSLVIWNKAKKIKEDLLKTDNEQSVVNVRSENPQTVRYYSRTELKSSGLDSILFSMANGSVYGPYLQYGSYNMVKLIDKKERPDTVSARHILISPNNPKVASMARAHVIADSLLKVLKNGGDFSALAAQYSDDPGSKNKGGLYENIVEGAMVKEFNDFVFSHQIGDIGTVETQYGVHIIDVTARKSLDTKIELAFIKLSITPSQKTYDDVYSQAMAIRGKITDAASFDKVASTNKIVVKEAPDINPGVYTIPGLENVREVVRWTFDAKIGDVSTVFQMPDLYTIAVLSNINEVGFLSLNKVKTQIINSVKQQKKVEKIYNDYFANANVKNLDALAKKVGVQLMPIPNISFNAYQLANIGYEPTVLASISMIKKDQTMGPIKGTNGVYVIKATKVQEASKMTPQEIMIQKMTMSAALKSRAAYQAFTAVKDAANIVDRRANFF